MKLAKLAKVNMEIEQLELNREMIRGELENLRFGGKEITISKDSFWDRLNERAAIYQENSSVYHSYSGKSKYSIYDVQNDKIYITNMRTGRNNSNFSKKTTNLAIERLIAHGGKIPVGQFIPVKMHEYTVVSLHPNLYERNGFVHWLNQEMILVTEGMIPEHNGKMPPDEWVSTDYFLAALLDGRKVLIGQGRKIVIFFREEHPHFNLDEHSEYPWQTKHWKWIGPGVLRWGHESATQKVVVPFSEEV